MKNMKKALCILTLALLSLALLAGCGSSGDKLSDPAAIEAYGILIWDNKLIDVCFTHDQEKIYIYYDDGDYALFETVDLPVERFREGDNDWQISSVETDDLTGNGYSDLYVYISHSDMSESNIVWSWEEGKGFVYQPGYSRFYYPIVIYDPLEGAANCDYSMYEGLWLSDADNVYENTYLQFDDIGGWQLYVDNEVIDDGYLQYDEEDSLIYVRGYRNSAVADGFIRMEDGRLNISTCGYFSYVDEG